MTSAKHKKVGVRSTKLRALLLLALALAPACATPPGRWCLSEGLAVRTGPTGEVTDRIPVARFGLATEDLEDFGVPACRGLKGAE